MKKPAQNENHAEFTRELSGGRSITYELDVAQPPKQARACGNGPRSCADRRPVDPPPVIKLSVLQDGKVDVTGHYEANFILFASLEFARPIANGNIYSTNHCPVLTGTVAAGASYLSKPTNAAYFIFPDLSVRHEGFYRLKFHLFEQSKTTGELVPLPTDVPSSEVMATKPNEHENMVNQTFVYTPPFQVFSAKKFPGLEMSTQLSQIMSEQGCRVRIRRDIRQRRPDNKSGKKDDEQRSLRSNSHDRFGSVDTYDNSNRLIHPANSRRPSIDSSYTQSRHQSMLPSPATGVLPPAYVNNHPPEQESLWQSSYQNVNMPPAYAAPSPSMAQGPMGPPSARNSYVPLSPATTGPDAHARLPPMLLKARENTIASLLTPIEPARPRGLLYDTEPVNKKRGLSRPLEDQSNGLKDHARPAENSGLYRPSPYLADPKDRVPLAAGNQLIEADANENSDEDDEYDSDSIDRLLEDTTSYRRADGCRAYVNNLRTTQPRQPKD